MNKESNYKSNFELSIESFEYNADTSALSIKGLLVKASSESTAEVMKACLELLMSLGLAGGKI